jgi:hypothetical protein
MLSADTDKKTRIEVIFAKRARVVTEMRHTVQPGMVRHTYNPSSEARGS